VSISASVCVCDCTRVRGFACASSLKALSLSLSFSLSLSLSLFLSFFLSLFLSLSLSLSLSLLTADTPVPVCTPMRMHAAQACPVKHAAADGTEYPRFSSLDSGPVSSSLSLPLPFSRPVPFSWRVQVVPQTPSTVNASNPRDIKPCDTDGAAVCIGNPHLSSPVSYSHLSHPLCLISSCAEYGLRRTSVK
jgi:hypothetical protein